MPISEVEQMNYAQYMLLNRGRKFVAKLEEQYRAEQADESGPTTVATSADDLDDVFGDGPKKRRKYRTADGGT